MLITRLYPSLLPAWALLVLLSACSTDVRVLRGADPAAPDPLEPESLGHDGPFGVSLIVRSARVRVDDVVGVDLFVPTEADGRYATERPTVIFVQGGLVAAERYRWLGEHLASRGFVVIAPSHLFDLPFFEQENAVDALETLRASAQRPRDPLRGVMDDGPSTLVGHSLGGVVASELWAARPELFEGLVLLASYPAATELPMRDSGAAIAIVGDADARVSLEQTRAGVVALETSGAPVTFAVIAGMNHMQVADRVSQSEAAAAGTASIDEASARAHVRWLLDAFLHRDAAGRRALADSALWPDGITPGPR